MDSRHVVSRSPANASAATVVTLIRNIEQLKNKDKLISQLERDLGHRWAAAQFASLERTQGEGAEAPVSVTPSCPPGVLPEGRAAPDSISWTPTSNSTPDVVEDERSAGDEGFVLGKTDLPKKLKDRNKELVEKCRAYLQRSKELTVQNRELKDSQERAMKDNNKLQELLEHSKLRLLQVTRQVTQLKAERRDVSGHAEKMSEMKEEMEEDKKRIAALTQACDEKDRRIELIKHRKKRRRVMGSAEKSMGVRETFYGYDAIEEDTSSVCSDTSSMSHSGHSQLSDDDIWGVVSREETERNYHRLAVEQLQLQRSHAQLQSQAGGLLDPQREALTLSQTQQDLFDAHCRIEQLEKLIQEIGEDEVISIMKEREAMIANNKHLFKKIEQVTEQNRALVKELSAAEDKIEDLEFRLIEFEELEDDNETPPCRTGEEDASGQLVSAALPEPVPVSETDSPLEEDTENTHCTHHHDMDQLRKELTSLLKGRGKEAESVLRKIDRLKTIEENAASMEDMAHELQKKVVALQTENDQLHSDLKSKGSRATEKQENLELKVQINELVRCKTELTDERDALVEQVADLKTHTTHLKRQLDIITSTPLKVSEVNSSDSESPCQSPRRRKSKSRGEDDSTPETKRRKNNDASGMKSVCSFRDVRSSSEDNGNIEQERIQRQVRKLEAELRGCKDENIVLMSRLKQSVVEKSSAAEADQGLTNRVHELENDLDLLRRENEMLAQRQQRREEELDSGSISPRTAELEEFCDDLQERLLSAESSERHLREKLKIVEGIIQDSEASEISLREANDRLAAQEMEAKHQLAESQKMVTELKDMLQDKDIQEQGLRIKVEFLQKAEAASVQRIEELEAVLGDLREQLELAGSGDEAGRLEELRKQMSFLETDNQALSSRVAELEENEETLRENWRRVAEDDLSRTQCLEEKLKMLQDQNRELKSKLSDAQEYFVINAVPQNMNSLASELAQSQTSLRSAAPYSGSDDSETEEDNEARQLREKMRKLERKMSEVKEQKDTKIESLQDKIVGFRENEIKLSETISEMEMTEREIRAKLALYESKEVTVEKMLVYQGKIQELTTSQESLLDQLEERESDKMTLQEKMLEMERTLRGKIVTLEVEMKSFKQKELKLAARIRELEKLEKELSEKVAQQTEKENGLYVRISALMDEVKKRKEENQKLITESEEKDEKVRKSKLLEVKLLEIEMEFGKKSSSLNSKLRHKEEELRQKEVLHEEEMKSLKNEMSQKTAELESMTCEKNEFEKLVNEMTEKMNSITDHQKQIEDMTQELSFMKSVGLESEEKLAEATEELTRETKKAEHLQKTVCDLENQLQKEKQTVTDLENQIAMLKDEISQKMEDSKSLVFEKEQEKEKEKLASKKELEVKIERINELEKQVQDLNEHINVVKKECEQVKSEAVSTENKLSERLQLLEASMTDKEEALKELRFANNEAVQSARDECQRMENELKSMKVISEDKEFEREKAVKQMANMKGQMEEEVSKLLSEIEEIKQHLDDKSLEIEIARDELIRKAKEHEEEICAMKDERELLEKELRNKVMFLNSQLTSETEARELQKKNLEQQGNREEALTQECDQYKREIVEKLSELELKNKDNCQLSLELSQMKQSLKMMQLEFDAARQNWSKSETDLQNQLQQKDQTINQTSNDFKNLQIQFSELESNLCEKEISIEELRTNNASMTQKLSEKELEMEEKVKQEVIVQEQMQQTAHRLQESCQEKENDKFQLDEIKRELQEMTALLKKKEAQFEEQEKNCEKMNIELVEVKQKLTYQNEELQEKTSLQKIQDKEIEVLKEKVEEAERDLNEKETKNYDSQSQMASQISSQQQDLAHAQEELQKCLQDIEQAHKECFIKDQQIKEKDQTYKDLLLEKQELTMLLEDQKQELLSQLDEQKEQTNSVDNKMAAVQQELKEAENRYRELEDKVASLELQLEERFASAQSAEKILVNKDVEFQNLQAKLLLTENQYAEACSDLEKMKDELNNQQKTAEEQYLDGKAVLQNKEENFSKIEADLEKITSEYAILKKETADIQEELSDCKEKLINAHQKESEVQKSLKEAQQKCEINIKQVVELQGQISETEKICLINSKNLQNKDAELKEKCSENENLIVKLRDLEEKLKSNEDAEEKITNTHIEGLNSKNEELTKMLSLNESELKERSQELETVKEHLEEVSHKLEDATCRLSALTEQHLTQQGELMAQTAQIEGLEVAVREKGHRCEFLEANLEDICLEKDAALSEVKHLETVVEKLETENLGLHEELDDASKEFENLRKDFEESKISIEGRLLEMAKGKEELEEKLKALEASSNEQTPEKSVEESKKLETSEVLPLEQKDEHTVNDAIMKYEALKEEYDVAQKDLSQEKNKSKMLKDRMDSLLADNESLTEECINLNHKLEDMVEKMKSVTDNQSCVDESQVSVSLVGQLSLVPNDKDNSNNNNSSLEIDRLLEEINAFKEKDSVSQQKLQSLETSLDELKDKDSKLTIRVDELEMKEKELLEHITDIEKTVIVPLETENDELKEELSDIKDELIVIKEERDEALAMLDTEEDSARDFQTLQKNLQDSLMAKGELEKNNASLSARVSSFDKEKEEFCQKIEHLETQKKEIEEKLNKLESLENQTNVAEEAENRLMDRVLDLEEKEQLLTADNEQLRTNETALNQKINYLEQKNEVLKDAEEKYMDKIMELEEIQHRYQSQLSLLETAPFKTESQPVNSVDKSESHSQVHVSQVHGIHLQISKSDMSVDTSDLHITSSQVPRQSHHIFESENERLKTDLDKKQSELDIVRNKVHLLEDSEAKLMEKLQEAQEKAQIPTTDNSEQEKKIETLLEENEFLAENIENYKRFFKEEKQKVNDLNDRLLEESSQVQELQSMVGEIQSEYEDQLQQEVERVKHLEEQLKTHSDRGTHSENTINHVQRRKDELEQEMDNLLNRFNIVLKEKEDLEKEKETLLKKISQLEIEVRSVVSWKKARDVEELSKQNENTELHEKMKEIEVLKQRVTVIQELREKVSEVDELREKVSAMDDLQKKVSELSTQNDKLQSDLDCQKQMEEDVRAQESLCRQELQGKVDALSQRKEELRAQHKDREQRLQAELEASSHREVAAVKALENLELELSEMRQTIAKHDKRGSSLEEEHQSDSGLSVDADRGRHDSLDYGISKTSAQEARNSPITVSSIATLTLTRPQSNSPVNQRCSPILHDAKAPSGPVAPPRAHRKTKSRGSSFDNSSDLGLLADGHETVVKNRIQELESKSHNELLQYVAELEVQYDSLKKRLKPSEAKRDRSVEDVCGVREEEEETGQSQVLNTSFSSTSSSTMLDRPEDILTQRIKELERLDQHNKHQMSELERDREVLHEIARKDKSSIHDLNVKIRELQLSERSLKEQVNSLESSESSLFSRCEEIEATKSQLEDRVHELEIHERRLRELVRKLKLDEEHWLSKSDGMDTALAELSANEQQLKRMLQDVELERGGMAERTEYMESRVQELEGVEISLLQRIKNYENNEVTLQNRLVHLENAEQAAQSKVSELEYINVDVSQRLQRLVEENSVMSQHNTQLHGQVQDLDRRLMTSRDAELAYKQHVEALQKNESSLQKKVREYELREIDSQARIRELEQTMEISQDKLATLQRSENKLKYRVQELEGIGGQIPGELTPGQRQKVPQKLEDCQKRVMVLQAQVESLQVQLRQALTIPPSDSTSQNVDANLLSVSKDDYNQLQTKVLLLDQTTCQLEEVEKLNEGLNAVILELRQGKGASGHEVEIEVLKRRLSSYKTLMQRLKSSLSTGQATSLLEPDLDSGPEGDSLSSPQLPGTTSERVLQSVRGNGKAELLVNQGDAPSQGLAHSEDLPTQASHAVLNLVQPTCDKEKDLQPSQPSNREESHWRAIEARRPPGGEGPWGGAQFAPGVTVTKSKSCDMRRQSVEEEEVTLGLHLPSESESRLTYNDTDSTISGPVPPPRRARATRAAVSQSSGSESNDGHKPITSELSRSAATANKKHFAPKEKSLPSGSATLASDQWALKKQSAPLMSFGEDSFYLPSSAPEVGDSSVSESDEAPPLPHSRPPGVVTSSPRDSSNGLLDGMTSDLQEKSESLNNSNISGISLRDRIAQIEKHLTDTGGHSDDDEVYYWKNKSSEATRQAEVLEKENKHFKEDINKLERELEEKRRYINLLELWLSTAETTIKNKDKQTDRGMLEKLQQDLIQLRKQLSQIGYRSEDALLDAAALKTELERREREVLSKKNEIDVLNLELKRSRGECNNIERMRTAALDSLRLLERELVGLENADKKSKELEGKLEQLQGQYDEMENYKNQAVNMIQPLQVKIDKLSRKCKEKDTLLRRLGAELRRVCHRPSSVLDDLTRLEHLMSTEENNNKSSTSPRGVNRSNSMEEIDFGYHISDTDSIIVDSTMGRRQRPAPYVNNRPRSADSHGGRREAHAHSHWMPRAHPHLAVGLSKGQFVAVADYDPAMFSQSGRRELELPLREGDHVIVTGSLDPSGYYEAVVSGQSGLVPASYLQPLNGHHVALDSHINHSPEETVDLYHRLNQTHKPMAHSYDPSDRQRRRKSSEQIPDPPRQLQIEGVVNEKSILLSWQPPPLDERGCTNGHKLLGYMVYLDGVEFEQVASATQCQLVVEGITSHQSHRLSVQCLCHAGFTSPRVELVFEGLVKLDAPAADLDTDLSSVLNSIQYKRGHKRMVMALYDYSPEHQSPNDYTALELAFAAGDVIHVYGDPRQDGFFHGEMAGKRGLVPACFVQDVSPEKLQSSSKRSS